MAGNVSQKDMEIISDGVLNGLGTVDQLPTNVKGALFQYWGSMGIDATKPDDPMTQAQLDALKQQREDQQGGIFNSPIFKPIEWAGAKLYAAYSATISPAFSAGAMAAHSIVYGRPDYIGEDGEMDALKDYWNYAHKVSPGQAVWMLGFNDKELKERGIRPDQISQDLALQEKGKYRDAKTINDPFGIQTRAQEYFGNGASKYVTGATDFAVSWYADPLVLAGKGASVAKGLKFTRPIERGIAGETKIALADNAALTADEANKVAWDNFSQKSHFESLTDTIMKIKTSNPDTAAAVMARDLPTLAKSANGPAAAKLLAQATDKNDVANVLRVTMGDKAALSTLEFKNSELAYQIKGLESRVSSVGSYYNGLSDAQKISPFGQRVKALMDSHSADIAKLDRDGQIVTDKMNAFATIGNLNYNAITTPAGLKMRNAFQASRDWRPFSDGGFIKAQTNNIYSLSLGGVVKLVHTYNDIKPSHYIDVADKDGWRQLNASLMEVKGLSREARDMYVSKYMTADEPLRAAALSDIETAVTHNIVDRYNLQNGLTGTPDEISHEVANGLYREIASKRSSAQQSMRSEAYGTASVDNPNLAGTQIRVDEITPDGGKTVVTPLLRSQMANGHSMMDFKLFENAIKANGSTWQKALQQTGTGWEKAVGVADYVNSIWKFSQLFRLGYGPRALADDALGQLAQFGPVALADRAIKGGRYNWEAMRRAATPEGALETAMVTRENLGLHIEDLTQAQAKLQAKLDKAVIDKRPLDAQAFRDQLNANIDDLASAKSDHADMDDLVKGGQAMKSQKIGRQVFAPAFGGTEGALFQDLASGDKNFRNMMGSASDSYLNKLRRMDWVQMSPAKHGADVHMNAWMRVLNQQVAHDALSVQYLKGKSPAQLESWLRSPEGLAYKRGHTIAQHLPNDQLVERVTTQLDEWINPAFPNADAIRQAVAEGRATKEMLDEIPEAARPLVNAQALSYARGSHEAIQLMDRAMSGFYNVMAQAPQRYLLRNPLFAQRYNVHLRDIMTAAGTRGETRMTEALRTRMESAARKRALDDVKKNTFTMDYETKMSHMMRNFGAFFGAQQESWNRWARIISDKPDILPRVAQVYGAPARAGIVTDQDGNRVSADGTVIDPVTGERRLVDYSDRHVVIQIPDYLGGKAFKKAFGLDKDATFDIPMSTAEIILNHGDGPIPVGAGPYVQMAANNIPFSGLDANGDPKLADMYQKLGILPFGASESNAQAFLPNWLRKAEGGDTLSDTYQSNLWYIMQAEDYKYREGLRKTQPTWKEISDRASKQSWMKVLFSATLPVSLSAKDPYDFFRNQYRQMQDVDPSTADQKFYDKYGDSAYTFSQSMSKNNSGLKPTAEAVYASQYYKDLISKVGPEWAGLVVGAEGEGSYSNGAFYYEKTHATDPASGTTMRSKMSARESLEQSNLSRGWRQYQSYMNGLYSQLFSRGLKTFDDEGAEDLKGEKQALVQTLSSPRVMGDNGEMQDNKYYNEAWSKAYNSFDLNYYDRATQSLRTLVDDPEIWSKAVNPDGTVGMRSDIYTLKTYLGYRDDVKRALIMRNEADGSADINAASNADIKQQWNSLVISLVEQDTKFGDLFNRYLSRDLGFDQDTVAQEQQTGNLPQFQGSTTQTDDQSIFDVLAQQGGVA